MGLAWASLPLGLAGISFGVSCERDEQGRIVTELTVVRSDGCVGHCAVGEGVELEDL